MRALEMLTFVVATVLGWALKHVLCGIAAGLLLPLRIYAFLRGQRFVWLEYVLWAVICAAWGRLIYDICLERLRPVHVVYAFAIGVTFAAVDALNNIPYNSPFRWLAWTPSLGVDVMYVDAAVARGFSVVRGSSLVHVKRKEGGTAPTPHVITFGGAGVDPSFEFQHFLISGKTGAGKSQAIYGMLDTVIDRGEPAIIADPGGAYLSRFGGGHSLVLNPFDARDVGWSPFLELYSDYDCQRLAQAAIPDAEGESRQWHLYSQTLLAEVLRSLWSRGNHSVTELLRLVLSSDVSELAETLQGTPAAPLAAEGNDRMLSSTRAICGVYLNAWRYLRNNGEFSVRRCVKEVAEGSATRWLHLVYRDDQMAMLRLLIATWLDLAIVETLSMPEQAERRLWFVMDELDSLGKVGSLRGGLTKLRKYGGIVVAGLQTIAQLRSTYGYEEAQVLLSCLSTKLVLSAGDAETARYFEHELGTQEVEHPQISESQSRQIGNPMGGTQSRNRSVHRTIQSTVLASEIAALPNLHGYLYIAGQPISRIALDFHEAQNRVQAFVPVGSR
jgi:hypothetical protein